MRISVPTIPIRATYPPAPYRTVQNATERVAEFLLPGNVAILTGAGVSVDSGIRAYRGHDGRYMNPNYKPIFYHQLMDESEAGYAYRQRYWLRSFLGWSMIRAAQPNPTHFGLAALQHAGVAPRLITQNVDGLHHQALNIPPGVKNQHILELHGSLHHVHCRHGHVVDRITFQRWLSEQNPEWQAFAEETERTGNKLRTNPDGDVAIEHLGTSYANFVVPQCPSCFLEGRMNSVHKPEIVFFGESIPDLVKKQSFRFVEEADRLLVVGTTLATYSAFRLLKRAVELGKPTLLLNVGPSRGDGVEQVERIDMASGLIITDVVKSVLGPKALVEPYRQMLASGVVKPPEDDTQPAEVSVAK
ncbi:DHS-like NAD/FAD-binding domain-containing protein [Roridomyces roridus]|uniref:DHS-like NAD/FAD-binding domain-containing protein n=1 Tax=Roridomyces roridus TaxID=1738132 RepID=A0AAD7FJ43_9AGAR|nr:DHS-like NAD/FAD-binding domain-containing protein [Roridomyces roridus]